MMCSHSLSVVYFPPLCTMYLFILMSEHRAQSCSLMWQLASDFLPPPSRFTLFFELQPRSLPPSLTWHPWHHSRLPHSSASPIPPLAFSITLDSPPHFTWKMAAVNDLPLLDALQAPSHHCHAKSIDNTSLPLGIASRTSHQPALASIPSLSRVVPSSPTMTTKIDIPALSRMLDAPTITAWLAMCEDTFKAWDLLNPTRPLDTNLRILLIGFKLESPVAAQWWCENREALKKLASWADFAMAVKNRFVPTSWHLDSLAGFYVISQGSSPF